MGINDGFVKGMTKVVSNGPASTHYNLVILGDGYQESELLRYYADVENFLQECRNTPPFTGLWNKFNFYRIDVVSSASGADDPVECGGTGAKPKTYFDATFCSKFGSARLAHLLTVTKRLVRQVVRSRLPEYDQILVTVNASKYGGSGNSRYKLAVFSRHSEAAKIAIHELGHSIAGLADEYENSGGSTGGEPPEPNVTRSMDRLSVKWRGLILPDTPVPTACYDDCPTCTTTMTLPLPRPPRVGTYEGANYAHCGTFRPYLRCAMRRLTDPFCPVCSRVIERVLAPFPEGIFSLIYHP